MRSSRAPSVPSAGQSCKAPRQSAFFSASPSCNELVESWWPFRPLWPTKHVRLKLQVLIRVPTVEEGDHGEDVPTDMESDILLLDLEEEALNNMSPYDPLSETSQIVCFEEDYPYVVPQPETLMAKAAEWVRGDESGRLVYLSAQEGTEEAPVTAPKKAARPKRVARPNLRNKWPRCRKCFLSS